MSNRGLVLATIGVVLVALALLVVLLVIADKPHFGWLVGSAFLPIMAGGIFLGAILLLIGTWMLPWRTTWRRIVLFVWALIAITSPLFGIMFLLPWAVLALSLPLVVWILYDARTRA